MHHCIQVCAIFTRSAPARPFRPISFDLGKKIAKKSFFSILSTFFLRYAQGHFYSIESHSNTMDLPVMKKKLKMADHKGTLRMNKYFCEWWFEKNHSTWIIYYFSFPI